MNNIEKNDLKRLEKKNSFNDLYARDYFRDLDNKEKKEKMDSNNKVPTPKEIVAYLDENVIGQNELKKTLSVAVYNHYKRVFKSKWRCYSKDLKDVQIEKSNVIILGNTGTGKTYTVKKIAELLNVPYFIADCTKFTEAGYVGADVETCLAGLVNAANGNINYAEKGIIMLDEIDKIAKKGESRSLTRDVGGEAVQQGLLKIVEGGNISFSMKNARINPTETPTVINTDNILFIGLGSFAGMEFYNSNNKKTVIGFGKHDKKSEEENFLKDVTTEDLQKFGMIPELIGRFPVITYTNPLKKEDLVKILIEPKNSLIKQYQKLFYFDGIKLSFTDKALECIAEIAEKKNIGARGLRGIIEKLLMDVMYEYSDGSTKKIEIDEDFVRNFYNIKKEKVV